MEDDGQLNADYPVIKFCISHILVNVSGYGLKLFVEAWNFHYITGIIVTDTYWLKPQQTFMVF